MNKVKVCILTSVHKPHDGRIFYKQATTLAKAGYEVSLIAGHAKDEVLNGVHIIPIGGASGRFDRMIRMQARMLFAALKQSSDIYHFHDPELIPMALFLKLLGRKVIYDVHELVYAQILDKNWIDSYAIKRVVQFFYRCCERLAVRSFDFVILAEDDYLNYFENLYGLSARFCVIRNSPILSQIHSSPALKLHEMGSEVVIYAGGLSRHRGIKEIVAAMGLLDGRVKLYLLGEWESHEFFLECKSIHGWSHTMYLGFRPADQVFGLMKSADIGISVLHPIKNYLTSLPTKVFEYMVCSLPVIVSDFPCWRTVFGKCAVFVDPYNPTDIAKKISFLLDNPMVARNLARQGLSLVEQEYNWDVEAYKLLQVYKKLFK